MLIDGIRRSASSGEVETTTCTIIAKDRSVYGHIGGWRVHAIDECSNVYVIPLIMGKRCVSIKGPAPITIVPDGSVRIEAKLVTSPRQGPVLDQPIYARVSVYRKDKRRFRDICRRDLDLRTTIAAPGMAIDP